MVYRRSHGRVRKRKDTLHERVLLAAGACQRVGDAGGLDCGVEHGMLCRGEGRCLEGEESSARAPGHERLKKKRKAR